MIRPSIRKPAPGARSRRGSALFAVVPLAILVLSLMVAFVGTSVETSRATVSQQASFRARAAAQTAASLAITKLWGDFESSAGSGSQMWALRKHLDKLGLVDQSTSDAPQRTEYVGQLGMPTDDDGNMLVDGVEIERLDVYRVDQWDSTELVIEVDAVARRGVDGSTTERHSSVQEIFRIAPPAWGGLDYALLANNINCLLCHTTIDNAERYYNRTPALTGTFEGVQLGSLETMHFRSNPDSRIAGRALIGGDAIYGDGDDIDWSGFNFKGARMDDGLLIEDGFGNLDWQALASFDPDDPKGDANLYLDFYEHEGDTDHVLPDSFPPPFPDNGGIDPITGEERPELAGNRVVDDSEFFAAVANSAGSVSGGNVSVVPKGDTIFNQALLDKMQKGTDSGLSGVTDGNVYLHGTADDPIRLDGDIAIDGDLIISGYVLGEGAIRARGNVYVPSDLIYADQGRDTASRTFGSAATGQNNSLAIAAGGNVVVGDPYRPAWDHGNATNGETNGSFNFIMDELAIFNRQEWIKTQPTLPGAWEQYETGVSVSWKDEKVKQTYWQTVTTYKWVKTGNKIQQPKYKWITVTTGSGPYATTTKQKVQDGWTWVDEKKKVVSGTKLVEKTKWVKTGKKIKVETPIMGWRQPEIDNPYYVEGHVPRYYSFGEGTPVPIFNKDGYFDPASQHWKSDERAADWDTSKLTLAYEADKGDPMLYDADGEPIAVVSTVAPTGGWITDQFMGKLIAEHQKMRQSGSKTLEIDATIYSANSILGAVTPRGNSDLNGELLVNGGIVAADVGLLAPGGTRINFDGRGARALAITSDKGLVVSRRLSAPLHRP